MKYYITTDTHLFHNRLIEIAGRPEGFTKLILDNNQKTVKPDDVYVHLGDIGIGDDAGVHNELMGSLHPRTKKWLVKGNHDKKSDTWYLSHGWDFVSERLYLNKYGMKILFTHKPVGHNWTFDLNIHGHFHNNSIENYETELLHILSNRNYLLALEYMQYRPVSLERIINKWRKEKKNGEYGFRAYRV